jgi:type I restriction enzyme, S subunit
MSDTKFTDTNEFPQEWQMTTVGDEFDIQLGKMLDAQKNSGSLKPYLGNKNIQWRAVVTSDLPQIPILDSEKERYLLKSGDLLVCEGGEVGRSALWQGQIAECYYQKALHRLRPKRDFSSRLLLEYLDYWTSNGELSNYISQTSIAHLTREKFERVPLPKPVPEEQRAIASALADMDALLDSLEELLTKKRQLKQAAMQELLTGKTRLDGFEGEWEEKRLGEVVSTPVTDGPHLTPKFISQGIPFLSVNNIVNGRIDLSDLRYISERDHAEFSKKCQPRHNDILLGKAASVGKIAIIKTQRTLNIWSPLALIRANRLNSPDFLYYALQGELILKQIILLTNTSSQGNIGMGDIESLLLYLPHFTEQKAIAALLSEMDAELEALEQRVTKTRDLKQGMMQELLTGRTRLV